MPPITIPTTRILRVKVGVVGVPESPRRENGWLVDCNCIFEDVAESHPMDGQNKCYASRSLFPESPGPVAWLPARAMSRSSASSWARLYEFGGDTGMLKFGVPASRISCRSTNLEHACLLRQMGHDLAMQKFVVNPIPLCILQVGS